ncbi:MAG: hypothetical protein IAE82_20795 [Opitutaceae bacterium]|nr:hypothetical protein [Opitutaceae bacterium]
MNPRIHFRRILAAVAAVFTYALVGISPALAQIAPKSTDIVQEIGRDGSVVITISMAFDAAAWKSWKALVGDEPARLRAMMRHQFAAYSLEGFQLTKDDLERTAKVTMRSAAGLELRKDGTFRTPVENYFRLVNNTAEAWFFSGNNPHAANSLNTVKFVLPQNARGAQLVNAGSVDQAVNFRLEMPAGPSRLYIVGGAVLLAAGLVLLAGSLALKPKTAAPA